MANILYSEVKPRFSSDPAAGRFEKTQALDALQTTAQWRSRLKS
ncbi:hypothetical protein [Leptolyngbya sp. FACHB-711]|nr:hypothetical protein [Leptolyngbya sp. FACHB-711]